MMMWTFSLWFTVGSLILSRARSGVTTSFTVRENAGAVGGSSLLANYPVSAIVPFGKGQVTDEKTLRIREGLPVQPQVLERWNVDGSIRHVLLHFQVSFTQPNQERIFHVTDEIQTTPFVSQSVVVSSQPSLLVVDTGKIRFHVKTQSSFNLIDKLWRDENNNGVYEDGELVIASNVLNGGNLLHYSGTRQYDSARSDLTVSVEESGPLRAVIRLEAPTLFTSTDNHIHGFAVRLYAYAGHDYVKVDYQLQNSARVVRSWPLYFQSMLIDLHLQLPQTPTVSFGMVDGTTHFASTIPCRLAQEFSQNCTIYEGSTKVLGRTGLEYPVIKAKPGYMHVQSANRGVTAVVRNFWQMSPNGLSMSSTNKMTIELFPEWSAQWADRSISNTGLYWLKDMQHVYKEMLLVFHATSPSQSAVNDLAATFQLHPTVHVPSDWYRQTRATLDMGGVLPASISVQRSTDTRSPDEFWLEWSDLQYRFYVTGDRYAANWRTFGDVEQAYRARPCTTGGFPYATEHLVSSGFSSHYFLYELWGIGELNVRPQWVTNYKYDVDQQALKLTENPYCGGTWRIFDGHGISVYCCDLLPGTDNTFPDYGARDDQHGWFYHVQQSYFYTGNYWVRDWYKFVVQFRSVRLASGDPYADNSSRAIGHAIAHALQAARVAGDDNILKKFAKYFRRELRPRQDSRYGSEFNNKEDSGGGFQTGYLLRSIINYMEYARDADAQLFAELFQYVSGIIEWNLHYGNFPYYFNQYGQEKFGVSDSTGMTMIDPQAWYFWNTGKQVYWDHVEVFMSTGINGGSRPYGAPWTSYTGSEDLARFYSFVKQAQLDRTPPSQVTDLQVVRQGTTLLFQWTKPSRSTRFHVVCASKPIVEKHSLDQTITNWWAADTVAAATTQIGNVQRLFVQSSDSSWTYFAVFSFDENSNMSPMSNVAIVQTGTNPQQASPPTLMQLFPPPALTPNPTPLPTATAKPVSSPSSTAIHIYPGDSFERAVESIRPGDTLIVHAGEYSDTGRISITVNGGSEANRVTIMGAPNESRPHITRPLSANVQNTINIEGASFLTIKGLEITSNGGDGIKVFEPGTNSNIVLEDLEIHGVAVGINIQADATRFTIRKNHIYDTGINGASGQVIGTTGEGMYLGCHSGSCVLSNSVIEDNWVHGTRAGTQGDGIELKKNSYGNTIRNNIIHDTRYPCLLLYGSGGKARNLVEGNAVSNCLEGGIQVAADAVVRNNVIFDSGIGFNSISHNGVTPGNLEVVYNTIVNADKCLNIRNWDASSGIVFANNAVYCTSDTLDLQGGTSGVVMTGNVVFPSAASFPTNSHVIGQGLRSDFADVSVGNFLPLSGSALVNGAVGLYRVAVDYDGNERPTSAADVGALELGTGSRSSCQVSEGFKTCTSFAPPVPLPTPRPTPPPSKPVITGFCFSGDSLLQVDGRGLVALRDVKVDDQVLVFRKGAKNASFEAVYSFAHFDPHQRVDFLRFEPMGLEVSANHYIYVPGRKAFEPASAIKVGDAVMLVGSDGQGGSSVSIVKSIRIVERLGAFAPLTSSGTIAVNGVVLSTYAFHDALRFETLPMMMYNVFCGTNFHDCAHFMTTVLRWKCQISSCSQEVYTSEGLSESTHKLIQSISRPKGRNLLVHGIILLLIRLPQVILLRWLELAVFEARNSLYYHHHLLLLLLLQLVVGLIMVIVFFLLGKKFPCRWKRTRSASR